MAIVVMGAAGAGKTTVGRALAVAALSRDRVSAVVACSALRERYRATIESGIDDRRWVFLDADAGLLAERLRTRTGHFAGPDILHSQLRELERPRHVLTLPAELPVAALVNTICTELGVAPIRPPRAGA